MDKVTQMELNINKTNEYKEDPETLKIWRGIFRYIESYRKFWGIGQLD